MRWIGRVVRIALSLVAAYLALGLGLILSQSAETLPRASGLDFSSLATTASETLPPLVSLPARDGEMLWFRRYPATQPGLPLLILLHGSGGHGAYFDRMARTVSERGVAEVVVPDLRGHGRNPARRGDIDHIGQLEEDIADLITGLGGEGREIVLGGHSSGGGLVIRFAGGAYGEMMDRAVLLAPFLQYDAPTVRPNSGGWAYPLIRRIIGLEMLNAVGINWFNHLMVIQFNLAGMPQSPHAEWLTSAYSYRLNTSYAPRRDYEKDLAALPEFLLLAGVDDEAFVAEQFEPVMSAATQKGSYLVLPGTGHIDLVNSPEAIEALIGFLRPDGP